MQLLEDRIRKDGKVREGNVLKVDSFLNHQMDVNLFREIGKEFQRRFAGEEITKILTIEASGIGIACVVAEIFNVPVVFAKKTQTKNIAGDVYTTKVESFTHGRVYDIIVSKEFLGKGDKVLLIDKQYHCDNNGNCRRFNTGRHFLHPSKSSVSFAVCDNSLVKVAAFEVRP